MNLSAVQNISIQLSNPVVRKVKKGHPWIFDKGIIKQNKEGIAGDLAVLYDQKRKFIGIGLFDPESPIKVRVLHRGRPTTIDTEWLKNKLLEIFKLRSKLIHDPYTTGYRLVNGENDGLPGLVVDRYDNTLVFKIYTAAWFPHLENLKSLFCELISPTRIILRMSRNIASSSSCSEGITDGMIIHGALLDGPVIFKENGIKFESEPILGQKTGFFLDQRDNRQRVGEISKGKKVLNVFSYTGGFSLYAAKYGAKTVISLDISHPALEASLRNFELNTDDENISKSYHTIICDDAFDALRKLAEEKKKFGVVILDPPSFAKKQKDVENALKAYERLVKLGLKVLEKDGILVSASCSARVPAEIFFDTVIKTAAIAKRPLHIIGKTQHAVDHPIGFEEGAYLKCIFAKASE